MSFHVFLSHSSADKPAVEQLASRLAKEGIRAWLDKWHLIPGNLWQRDIEKATWGYVPKSRKAEDGRIDDRYNLVKLTTSSYPARTRRKDPQQQPGE
jgi:hypothetical protein